MTPDQIDLSAIVNPWQAIVLVVFLLCAMVVPQVGAWVQARRSASAVNEVKKTLTTNNGGSHIKDALDRIERGQADQAVVLDDLAARVTTLETAAEKRGGRLRWR